MDDPTAALITAFIAFVGVIIGLLAAIAQQKVAHQQEKERILWAKRAEKLLELESAAGFLKIRLPQYGLLVDGEMEPIQRRLLLIDEIAGSLQRYDEIVQPIRDFQHSAGILWINRNRDGFERFEQATAAIDKFNGDYKVLLETIDKVSKKR